MQVSEKFRQYLATRYGNIFEGGGYTIKEMLPDALIYSTGGKHLTLTGELFKKEGSWWIFGNYFGIYLENPLRWDNVEEAMPADEAELALSRVTSFLDRHRARYQYIPSTRSSR
jgi:hypothetical protein